MNRRDQWKLAEELNVYQIVLLIAGYDPGDFEHESSWTKELQAEVSPYVSAIKNAVRAHRIETKISRRPLGYNEAEIDWDESLIDIESFREWLRSRNFCDGYFVPVESGAGGLLDLLSEFYAPKLAAAVRAWTEVTSDPEALKGKPPKKALEIWLRKHANEYGLTDKKGNPNELGIEEVCKVANWRPQGGATRTPTPLLQPSHPSLATSGSRVTMPPTRLPSFDKEDEIPF